MNNATLVLKVKERINKLDSQDYDNFDTWLILEAFNKAQLQWSRQMVGSLGKGGVTTDEASKQYVDDLEVLITTRPLKIKLIDNLYEEADLPEDYLGMKAVLAGSKTNCCGTRLLKIDPCEQANVVVYLRDTNRRPSFEWAETFYTLGGNRVQIYTNGEFSLDKPALRFYREPRPVQILGVLDLKTELPATQNVSCEFRDSVTEMLIDRCVGILAGDTENITQYQRSQQEVLANS